MFSIQIVSHIPFCVYCGSAQKGTHSGFEEADLKGCIREQNCAFCFINPLGCSDVYRHYVEYPLLLLLLEHFDTGFKVWQLSQS